jgi:PAS domain S-box-containing protein
VFGPLQAFLSVGLTVKATGLALFLLLTGVVAHNLSRPLRQLSQAASQVAAGNLDARARVRGRGELGLLGATFDAMVERIQRWHRDLNAEVEARKHAEEELQELLRFERLMTQISTEFAAMPAGGFLLVVDQEVRRLMEFLKADRAWLVEFVGEEARSMMHKTEGAVSTPQSFAPDQLPWCMAELRERRRLHFSTLEDLPAAAALDRKVLEEIRVRSMLALPLSVSGEVLGGFIFAVTTQRCAWPAPVLQRIQLVEDLFANLLRQFRSEQALTEAETRFHTVANFMQDWEYWRRPDGSLQFCSSACERITGYGPEQFLANGQLFAEIVLPEDAHLWQAHECKASDHSHTHLSTLELRIRRADGQVRWIEHTCRPVVTKQGEFLGIRAANRDVTIPKLAELETQRLREELSRMTRVTTLDHLAASLSHELRQPLTAIMSNAEAAEQFLSLPTPDIIEVREALRDVIRNSEHAGAVIQRLRSLYRKTSRQEQSTLDVNQLIEDTLDLLRSELILRQVTCYMELTPGLPAVSAVRVEVQQVLLNLTLNALDAMSDLKPETRQLAIKTTIEEPRSVSVIVRDTGPGIHPTVADRLFEPFMTTKAAGMGLGLAISRAIIEAHGGRIWATNNSRRGASLHFTLPVFKGN